MRRSAPLYFLSVILALLACPLPADAQQPGKVYRIGWLASGRKPQPATPEHCALSGSPIWQAFVAALREHGYIQGQNLVLECRYTEGREARAPALAADLVNRKVDLIVANGTNQVRAAKQATGTIPIVMRSVINPVGRGLVDSLARPGGNVTGHSDDAGLEILGKYLELLKQAVPTASRVAALNRRGAAGLPTSAPTFTSTLEREAQRLGVTLQFHSVQNPEELEGAFVAMAKAQAEALLIVPSTLFAGNRQRIVGLAARSRLPAMYPDRQDVEAGGLMAYAVDEFAIVRRVASYIDRILDGEKPGDLPVEQPTGFQLILNLKTAKALGLTIPPTLLLQADKVIE